LIVGRKRCATSFDRTCAEIGSSMSQNVAIMPPWQMRIGLQWRSSTRKPS
jgi:hypothetical protein